jgi:hypothetical protein
MICITLSLFTACESVGTKVKVKVGDDDRKEANHCPPGHRKKGWCEEETNHCPPGHAKKGWCGDNNNHQGNDDNDKKDVDVDVEVDVEI